VWLEKIRGCLKVCVQNPYFEPTGAKELAKLIIKAAEDDEGAWKRVKQVNITLDNLSPRKGYRP
jgi:hypothetical protein